MVTGLRFVWGDADVFRLESKADESTGEVLKTGDAGGKAEGERGLHRAFLLQGPVKHSVGEGLDSLGAEDGGSAVVLHLLEMMSSQAMNSERVSQDIGRGDSVLQGDVDADAADGGHGMGGIADAKQAGKRPALEVIDLHGEQLDVIPGIDLGCATGEEGGELLDTGAKGLQAAPLNLRVVILGDDEARLKVIMTVDQNEGAAEVHVTESVLGIGGLAREAKPQYVDGNTLFYNVEMGGPA